MSVSDDGEFQQILDDEAQAEKMESEIKEREREAKEIERFIADARAEMNRDWGKAMKLCKDLETVDKAMASASTDTAATTVTTIDPERVKIYEENVEKLTRALLRAHPAPDHPVVRLQAETAARAIYHSSNTALWTSESVAQHRVVDLDLVQRLQHLQAQATQNAHRELLLLELIARRHEEAQARTVHRIESRRRRAGCR